MNRDVRALFVRGILMVWLNVGWCSLNAQVYQPDNIIWTPDNYGLGTSLYYANAYSGAGDVTNFSEFLPNGYNATDPSVKYPIIFFFPGLTEVKGSDPSTVKRLGIRGIFVEIEGGNVPNPFNYIVIGLQGVESSSPADYYKFITDFILPRYGNKVDQNRLYLTGLSLGGGKVIEFMADATRASKIAAIAPIAIGPNCLAGTACGNNAVTNMAANTSLGIFFTHNRETSQSTTVYTNSVDLVNAVNAIVSGKAGLFLNEARTDHDAWSYSYTRGNTNFAGGKNMYQWFSGFSLSSSGTMPVKLTRFTAQAKGSGTVELNWTTAQETNSSHFLVERSVNGKDFYELGRLTAAGNANVERNYRYTDKQAGSGTVYYRLKQVDKDGQFEYSETKKLNLSGVDIQVAAAPNPVRDNLRLDISGAARATLTVSITDQAGRTVRQFNVVKSSGSLQQTIDLSSLSAGLYVMTVKGENINYVTKLVKQ